MRTRITERFIAALKRRAGSRLLAVVVLLLALPLVARSEPQRDGDAYTSAVTPVSEPGRYASSAWWDPKRLGSPLALLALSALAVGAWAYALRRQVAMQTILIRRQLEHEAALENRYTRLFERNLAAFVRIDGDGRIIEGNPAMARLLGVGSPAMLIGSSIGKACVFPEHAEAILSPPSDGAAQEICLRNAVGEDVWALASSMQAAKGKGAPAVIEATLTDVTRLRHYERELRHAKSVAEEANRAKSDFLANMSHEIRTPLNGVLGMTQLALDGDLPREEREYLKLAKLSAESLLTVINDILDFSKIEAGKIDMEVIAFNPREAFAAALKTLAARASEKTIELIFDVDDAVPDSVRADPTRLRQVILNLVGNAIKFTDQGEVALRITADRQKGRQARLRFEVSDTGVGIPVEKHQTIFESFSQADGSTTRKYGGTGLGLAICSRLVRLMDGDIKLESEPMHGSRFYFSIPLRAGQPTAADQRRKSELGGRSALVVDDHAGSRDVLTRILASAGMRVEPAGDATEAIEKLRSATARAEPFGLLLVDSKMPNMDGLALIESVESDSAVRSLPALLLSPAGERVRSTSGAKLNIAARLGKPVSRDELIEAVARALFPKKEAEGARGAGAADHRDELRPLHVLLAEDNVVNRALVTRLLLRAGCSVEAAVNGKEAVDAVARQEFDLLLMDVQMPEMDGLEATRHIRKTESGRRMPILALTAHAMKGDKERCIEAGMDAYLSKPVDPTKLFEAIERLAGPRSKKADSASADTPTTAPAQTGKANRDRAN